MIDCLYQLIWMNAWLLVCRHRELNLAKGCTKCILYLLWRSRGASLGLWERDGAPVREEGLANHCKLVAEWTCVLGRPRGHEGRRGSALLTQIASIKKKKKRRMWMENSSDNSQPSHCSHRSFGLPLSLTILISDIRKKWSVFIVISSSYWHSDASLLTFADSFLLWNPPSGEYLACYWLPQVW